MQKITKHIKPLLFLYLLLLFACEQNLVKSNDSFDDQLIQSIIDAEKADVNLSDLPILSSDIIERDYNEYVDLYAKKASNLGYQVSMDEKNYKIGHHNEVYFNLEGRELKSKRGYRKKEGFRCFEVILPATFVMPDASSIIIQNEDDYMMLKDWYENNLETDDKPSLQYPVDIIYKDGDIETVNNDEEMMHNKMNCRDWDDEKKDDCFTIVYPISFIMPDGSNISMLDEQDWDSIKFWYEQNSNVDNRPILQYPITIINKDNSSEIINNDDEMLLLKQNCRN